MIAVAAAPAAELCFAQPADEALIGGNGAALDVVSARASRPDGGWPMTNVLARKRQDLSGEWRYLIDPMRAGLRKSNSRRDFPADRVATGNELIEYEWNSAPAIVVPGDWNSQVRELANYDDLLWYRRIFEGETKPGKRQWLYFEGANYRTHVYLNGALLGVHEGGFTPFAFEASAAIREGRNSLVVAVDARHGKSTIPGDYFDWHNYGGITRPVHLVETPETYVHDYRLWLEDRDGEDAVLRGEVTVMGRESAGAAVRVNIAELGSTLVAVADDRGKAAFTIQPGGLRRWSPEDPHVYGVELTVGDETLAEKIGFRTLDTQGAAILLNGEPLFLKGISLHEEAIGKVGSRRVLEEEARALLGHAKALGANFVRLAHYPHNERTTRLADELGLIVWSEIPIYWEVIDYSNPQTLALARGMQAANVARDFNRASIAVWSVANETPITPARNAFLSVLIEDLRAYDDARFVSAALNKNRVEGNLITIDDPIGAQLDVLAVNTYEGWYGDRTTEEIGAVRWSSIYTRPVIFSEFGAGALRGFRSKSAERWSEEYQAALYAETLAVIERTPFAAGLSPWILKDFRSPRRWHGRFQNYWNRKGLISETGKRKLAFDVLRKWYAER